MDSITGVFSIVASTSAVTANAAAAPLFILGKLDLFSSICLLSSVLFVSSMSLP
jgi:hypothetical protein